MNLSLNKELKAGMLLSQCTFIPVADNYGDLQSIEIHGPEHIVNEGLKTLLADIGITAKSKGDSNHKYLKLAESQNHLDNKLERFLQLPIENPAIAVLRNANGISVQKFEQHYNVAPISHASHA